MTGSNPYDPQQPPQQPYPPQPYPPQPPYQPQPPYPPQQQYQPYPPQQPYTPYSYSGPPNPGQPKRQFVQRRSPIQAAMRIVIIVAMLFVLGNLVFFACKSSRHNPSAAEMDLSVQTSTSESATR